MLRRCTCAVVPLAVVLPLVGEMRAESVARIWNEQNLDAIRIDFPNPPVHARNLFHVSVAMWDAWAAYDAVAVGYLWRENAVAVDVAAARREAISFAAYRVLASRYARSVSAPVTLAALRAKMLELGYDPDQSGTVGGGGSAVGNRIAAAVLQFAASDGSNESGDYADPLYAPVNDPLILAFPSTTMADPNRWQPLAFEYAVSQNGLRAEEIQSFLGSHWGAVRPFAMAPDGGAAGVYFDPGQPPQLGGLDDTAYKYGNATVIRFSSFLDPDKAGFIDISPAVRGNNSLGQNDGIGHAENPSTGVDYAENIVPHGDYGRVVAEFWADGPESETPPGHWNTLANAVAEHPQFERRMAGAGPVLDELEWDVKVYFALNGAVHDAAIAAWGCKGEYDYVRPISSIRYMASRGQSSDSTLPSYHPNGIPLEPGLIEVVTTNSAMPGQRHDGLLVGEIAIYAWGGEPANPATEYTGTRWIRAKQWLPYQLDTFVTPAFAGYVSGHSAFSRAAAEVLAGMTGSPYFPGGMATFTAPQDGFLKFERGPSVEVVLQWATYFDAADEAGLSRLYGGIHVPVDDGPGRVIGSQCGTAALSLASRYFDGSILNTPPSIDIAQAGQNRIAISAPAIRGMRYRLEVSDELVNFVPVGIGAVAEGGELVWELDIEAGASKQFRIRRFDSDTP